MIKEVSKKYKFAYAALVNTVFKLINKFMTRTQRKSLP